MKRVILFLAIVSAVGCKKADPTQYQFVVVDSLMVISNNGTPVASVPLNRTGAIDSILVDYNQ